MLDNLSLLTLTDRYTVQIAVIPTSVLLTEDSDGFRFQVAVTAVSETLPLPTDWVLVIAGMDNISTADTTYALVLSGNSAQIDAIATSDDPLLPSSILLSLEDRPSLLNTTGTSLAFQLPAVRRLAQLTISAPAEVTEIAIGAAIVIAVSVTATDQFGRPFDPTGLTLNVTSSDNAEIPQSSYALTFTDGLANTTVTVELASAGDTRSIELSVVSGDIDDSKASCLVLAATLPANTRIGFSLRTDSEAPADRLVFAADNQLLIPNFSADSGDTFKDWEQTDVLLSNPVSKLSWCYLKNTSGASGMDAANSNCPISAIHDGLCCHCPQTQPGHLQQSPNRAKIELQNKKNTCLFIIY